MERKQKFTNSYSVSSQRTSLNLSGLVGLWLHNFSARHTITYSLVIVNIVEGQWLMIFALLQGRTKDPSNKHRSTLPKPTLPKDGWCLEKGTFPIFIGTGRLETNRETWMVHTYGSIHSSQPPGPEIKSQIYFSSPLGLTFIIIIALSLLPHPHECTSAYVSDPVKRPYRLGKTADEPPTCPGLHVRSATTG